MELTRRYQYGDTQKHAKGNYRSHSLWFLIVLPSSAHLYTKNELTHTHLSYTPHKLIGVIARHCSTHTEIRKARGLRVIAIGQRLMCMIIPYWDRKGPVVTIINSIWWKVGEEIYFRSISRVMSENWRHVGAPGNFVREDRPRVECRLLTSRMIIIFILDNCTWRINQSNK